MLADPGNRARAPEPLRVVQAFVNTRDIENDVDELSTPAALARVLEEIGAPAGGAAPHRVRPRGRNRGAGGPSGTGTRKQRRPDRGTVARRPRSCRSGGTADDPLRRARRPARAADGRPRRRSRAHPRRRARLDDRRHVVAPQGMPARRLPLGVLRPLPQRLGQVVLDVGVRQPHEHQGVPSPRHGARLRRLTDCPRARESSSWRPWSGTQSSQCGSARISSQVRRST